MLFGFYFPLISARFLETERFWQTSLQEVSSIRQNFSVSTNLTEINLPPPPSHFQPHFTHRFYRYIVAGCFRFKPEDGLCSREVCQSSSPYKILGTHKRAKFCCCFGDLCNNNITDVNTSVSSTEDTVTPGYFLNCCHFCKDLDITNTMFKSVCVSMGVMSYFFVVDKNL